MDIDLTIRAAKKEDCHRIAELDYIASGGTVEYLFRDLVPNLTPTQIVAETLAQDNPPYSFSNAIVAELDNEVIGMSISYPAEYHRIDDEMRTFFPADRLEHFKEFFSTRVENSYLIDAFCVAEGHRSKGIGARILEGTGEKALKEGFRVLSLMVFADNFRAIRFYQAHGFSMVKRVGLKEHELIPHKGGCLLMEAAI